MEQLISLLGHRDEAAFDPADGFLVDAGETDFRLQLANPRLAIIFTPMREMERWSDGGRKAEKLKAEAGEVRLGGRFKTVTSRVSTV